MIEDLKLLDPLNEHTKKKIALNTLLYNLKDENHFYQLESEVKGLGDVARLMWVEDCLSLLKEIVGDSKERVLEEFKIYNDIKMKEYFESKANENNN